MGVVHYTPHFPDPKYVDDKLLARNNECLLDSIQDSIGTHFKSSDLGIASWVLGIHIHHNTEAGTLSIEQSQYIKGVLSHYGMTGCMPVSTPLPANSCFQPASPNEHSEVSSYPYLEVLGSLTYATMGTHPDISYTVRSLAPYASNFGHDHINRLKHIMRYLASCPKQGILYTREGRGLIGYTDMDWASDQTNWQLISGYVL